MTATQLPLAAPPHRNQQLFSPYYLDHILPDVPAWKLLVANTAPVLAQIRQIFDAYTSSKNEAQTEKGLVQPVMEALSHTVEMQGALKTPDGTKKPDYVLYCDECRVVTNKEWCSTRCCFRAKRWR